MEQYVSLKIEFLSFFNQFAVSLIPRLNIELFWSEILKLK